MVNCQLLFIYFSLQCPTFASDLTGYEQNRLEESKISRLKNKACENVEQNATLIDAWYVAPCLLKKEYGSWLIHNLQNIKIIVAKVLRMAFCHSC